MRGRKHPLVKEPRKAHALPRTAKDVFDIPFYQIALANYSPAEKTVRDLVAAEMEVEAQKLSSAIDTWISYRGIHDDYRKANLEASQKLISLPFASRELLENIKNQKNAWGQDSGMGNPWLSPGLEDLWCDLFFNCMSHGPQGEKIAAEKLYPAILKYQELKEKYAPRDPDAYENITTITDYLTNLHTNGRFDKSDLVNIRKYFSHRHYNSANSGWQWRDEIATAWNNAALETIRLSQEEQNVGLSGMNLLLAFNQQAGVPFDNAVDKYLLEITV